MRDLRSIAWFLGDDATVGHRPTVTLSGPSYRSPEQHFARRALVRCRLLTAGSLASQFSETPKSLRAAAVIFRLPRCRKAAGSGETSRPALGSARPTLAVGHLDNRELIGRGAKTLREYQGCVDHLLRPHLGGIAIAKLRPVRISEWIATTLKSGSIKGGALSVKTVYHAFALLNGALHWAVQSDLPTMNPCAKLKSHPSVPRSQAKALSGKQITKLIATARGTRLGSILRPGALPRCATR
jgi:hypothetical protein